MHKVCDIRNPELRVGKDPRETWAEYVRDLCRLIDRALDGGSLVNVNASEARENAKKAA